MLSSPSCSLLLPFRYFNSGSAPLECDKEFWDLRDSVVQCELLILRQLNFQVSFEHPHKVVVSACARIPVPSLFGVNLLVGLCYCLIFWYKCACVYNLCDLWDKQVFSVGLNAFSFTYMTLTFNKILGFSGLKCSSACDWLLICLHSSNLFPGLWSLSLSAVFHLQYLLHYLLSVKSLVNRHAWSRTPVAETSWALLRDCYHGAMCIHHRPQHIAIAMLYLALNSYGVELPAGEREWWQVRAENCS